MAYHRHAFDDSPVWRLDPFVRPRCSRDLGELGVRHPLPMALNHGTSVGYTYASVKHYNGRGAKTQVRRMAMSLPTT